MEKKEEIENRPSEEGTRVWCPAQKGAEDVGLKGGEMKRVRQFLDHEDYA